MAMIPNIRPVSDLRNNYPEISQVAHATNAPVFLTKNGRSDMVLMSIDAYENNLFESEVYRKLRESEVEAANTTKRYSHDEVFDLIFAQLEGSDSDTGAA